MDSKLKTMARTGYVAKGAVYSITGILTFMAAFNMGGSKTGKVQVLQFLDQQTFGNILLVLMGLGLACYASWRFIQAISDPENIGDDKRGGIKRFGFFISGLIYLGLAVLAIWRVIGSGSGAGSGSGSGSSSPQNSEWLASETGLWVLGAVGVAIIGVGIFQFIKAYKGKYWWKFDAESSMEPKRRKTIKNSANFGLSARGVIFLIIGYFALNAAFSNDPSEIKTTAEAFAFLQEKAYGAYLMGIVAAGMVCYAIYMFMMAKYRKFRD